MAVALHDNDAADALEQPASLVRRDAESLLKVHGEAQPSNAGPSDHNHTTTTTTSLITVTAGALTTTTAVVVVGTSLLLAW
jgi:hypothetical protein